MLLGLLAVVGSASVFGVAAICQAVAARSLPVSSALDPRLIAGLLRRPVFWLAIALNLLGFVLHVVALRLLPLFVAQAGVSASLAVTAVLAVRMLGDSLRRLEQLSVLGVCVGLAMLSAAAGKTGVTRSDPDLTVALVAAVAAVAVLGVWASRGTGTWSVLGLGCVAGAGFAAVSIATRLVPDVGPGALISDPAAYVLVVSGALAFLFYSLGLQRGKVTGVTAPLVVVQTALPALVGIALLGDAVRTGWVPFMVAGLLLTGGCAIALGRFEAPREPITQPQQ